MAMFRGKTDTVATARKCSSNKAKKAKIQANRRAKRLAADAEREDEEAEVVAFAVLEMVGR